jgi:hypothetical protein
MLILLFGFYPSQLYVPLFWWLLASILLMCDSTGYINTYVYSYIYPFINGLVVQRIAYLTDGYRDHKLRFIINIILFIKTELEISLLQFVRCLCIVLPFSIIYINGTASGVFTSVLLIFSLQGFLYLFYHFVISAFSLNACLSVTIIIHCYVTWDLCDKRIKTWVFPKHISVCGLI